MAEISTLLYSALSILSLLLAFKLLVGKSRTNGKKLPPSPFGLPIIGHLHLLKHPIHRSLKKLSEKYGPIFSLRLGSRLVVVVSSPEAVEECFTKNDIIFANRPQFVSGQALSYGNATLGAASYGDHWRNLRRLSTLEIFSSTRLNMSTGIRKNEINILLHKLYRVSRDGIAKVELKSLLSELAFNMIMRMVAGKRYYGEEVSGIKEAKEFRELMSEVLGLGAYPGDFLPFLKWVDGQGYLKKVKKLGTKVDSVLQGLIDEHRTIKKSGGNSKNLETENTMINHLLSLQETQSEYYTDETIKGLIVNMLSAGSDTSSVAIEWALANLLNHPSALNKARAELNKNFGEERLLDEDDLPNLKYLQNIISETLRLYPPAPLLVPHFSSESCSLGGYHVPANTMLMVNAWALHRDPKVWEDSTSFKPERFQSGENGTYKSLPFGSGRRACPGMGMANRVMALTLGSLLQCFDWDKVDSEKEIDMTEGQGLSMPKADPLVALCKPRPLMIKLASASITTV